MATKKVVPAEEHDKLKSILSAISTLATAGALIAAPFVKNPGAQQQLSAELQALNVLNGLFGRK